MALATQEVLQDYKYLHDTIAKVGMGGLSEDYKVTVVGVRISPRFLVAASLFRGTPHRHGWSFRGLGNSDIGGGDVGDIADMGADPFGVLPRRQRHSPLMYPVLISSVCLVRPSSASGTRTWH